MDVPKKTVASRISAFNKHLDPRTLNTVIILHLCVMVLVAFFCLFMPLYSIVVTDPIKQGPTVLVESPYTLHCYVFRATIHPSNCYQPSSWNACYNILKQINTGQCDQDKLVVGSENLESYGATVDVAIILIFLFLVVAFVFLLGFAYPSDRKNDFNRLSAFFHFLAAIMALILAHVTVSVIDETTIEYKHGIGQSPHIQPTLYIIAGAPLVHLILDNFHSDIV